MRRVVVAFVTLLLAACGPDGVVRAKRYEQIDWAACLASAEAVTAADESVCPGFVSEALGERIATCRDVGGKLLPIENSAAVALDVDGDGQLEFLFDAAEHYYCDGAPSVFSCGSLGCPAMLVANDGGQWQTIGFLDAAAATEVLPPEPGQTFRTLRSGCPGGTPCDEWTYYDWTGSRYEAAMIEVRGQRVDVAPGGLWTLTEATAVLASPAPNARILARYDAGTLVVVMGTARGAPYTYISPCNACESGFVAPSSLAKQ